MNAQSKIRSHSTTGADGAVFVNSTTPAKGEFYAVQVVAANSKITLDGNLDGAAALGAVGLPTGYTVYGRFDKVTVTAGSAILYRV